GGARAGGGVGGVGRAEAEQGDGLPGAAPREPGADEQSRRAAEPAAAVRGEGALPLAQAEVGGALGGVAAGRLLAAGRRCGEGSEASGGASSSAVKQPGQGKGGLSGGDQREVSKKRGPHQDYGVDERTRGRCQASGRQVVG